MDQILNILGSLGFNWHVALANFINFLIILFLLNKFFFGKLGKVIEHRQEVIEKGLSQASDAERALHNAEEEKVSILKAARKEGKDIIAQSETNANMLAETIIREAEGEAQAKLNSLIEKENTLTERVEKSFAERAPELVAQLYRKTLSETMTADDNNALIARTTKHA